LVLSNDRYAFTLSQFETLYGIETGNHAPFARTDAVERKHSSD